MKANLYWKPHHQYLWAVFDTALNGLLMVGVIQKETRDKISTLVSFDIVTFSHSGTPIPNKEVKQ